MKRVWYHANCSDGFAAAWAAWRALGDQGVRYVPVQYGEPVPHVDPCDEVYILDFSYSREVLCELAETAMVEVHDHHASAERALADLPFARCDREHSGAVLAWQRFHGGEPVPQLLEYVEDRDLWRWALADSREVNAAVGSYQHSFQVWTELADRPMASLAWEGTAILRARQRQIEALIGVGGKRLRVAELGEYMGVAVCAPLLQSEVCEEILRQWPEMDFALAWFEDGAGQRIVSLRSRAGGMDVSVLAERFGGGGHPRSAGFAVPAGGTWPW